MRARTQTSQPAIETVFFGGGTPTQLPSADLVRILDALRDNFGLASDVEVTTEANPDSVTPESLATLRAGGFNRISFGVQSAVPHVLATLWIARTIPPTCRRRCGGRAKQASSSSAST